MSDIHFPEYDPARIRAIPFPGAEDYGDGWWRIDWEVRTNPADPPRNLRLPRPFPDLEGISFIVAVVPREPGVIIVEHLTRYPKLIGEEAAYISLILQELRALYTEITIGGYRDHPILNVAKRGA